MTFYPLPSETPEPCEASSIYEQVGGYEALQAVVDAFYTRVLADEALGPFFAGTNMTRMKGRQVEFFSAALGGPDPYIGAAMKQVHRGRGITKVHFDLVAGHLADAMTVTGVRSELLAQILATVSPLADDICSGP
ncbi:group 1 truncated hemoglobin [Nocardia salmonicida]|uniref:group 1 truncated hemoglobin n=1 Tax=Nocardia salmonicida TaxID=53431 RepID=UPI0037885DBC